MISDAKGLGGGSEAHRGLGLIQNARTMIGGEVLRRRQVGSLRAGGYRRALMFRSPWIASRVACEGVQGVKESQGAPAAMNRDGGAAHWRQLRHEFSAMQGRRIQLLGSGRFWMARACERGGCSGLRRSKAAQPR
jgi:hypothetical protein